MDELVEDSNRAGLVDNGLGIPENEEQTLLKAQEAQDEKAYQDQFRKTFVTDL
jgi:hypothetical protein